ncbi:hypothetical protein [Desulfocastanea catecholica]
MKLICPACGAIASAESWMNDAHCRETLLVISRLPAPLPKSTLGYLSLFRPGKQALSWKKVLRLVGEIETLTAKSYVHVAGRVDRNCPARIWAQAMEQMVERRTGLTLPMPNHNYLTKIAYDMADQADYQGEKKQNMAARQHVAPVPDRSEADPLLDPMEKARREWDERHGAPSAAPDFNSLKNLIKGMD